MALACPGVTWGERASHRERPDVTSAPAASFPSCAYSAGAGPGGQQEARQVSGAAAGRRAGPGGTPTGGRVRARVPTGDRARAESERGPAARPGPAQARPGRSWAPPCPHRAPRRPAWAGMGFLVLPCSRDFAVFPCCWVCQLICWNVNGGLFSF